MQPQSHLFEGLFLSVGAMKAGTTWIYSVLERHPELFFTFEKEIHYFYARHVNPDCLSEARRMENATRQYLRFEGSRLGPHRARLRLLWIANYLDGPLSDAWYRNLFFLQRGQSYACDFSNLHALLPEEAWAEIRRKAARLRVLYTLRDPARRLWSHVKFHLKVTGQSDRLDQWSPRELERFARSPFIWENAEYGESLRRLRRALDPSELHVASYETIRSDPLGFIRPIEAFLGLAPGDYPADVLNREVNSTDRRPPPAEFLARFEPDFRRIAREVREAGFAVPESWSFR
jgi:hypothetical protein